MEGKRYHCCLKGRHGDRWRSAWRGPTCPLCHTLHLFPNDHSGPGHTSRGSGPLMGTRGYSTPTGLSAEGPGSLWPDSPNFCFPASSTLSTFDRYPGGFDTQSSDPSSPYSGPSFTASVPPTVVQGLIPVLTLLVLSANPLGFQFPHGCLGFCLC